MLRARHDSHDPQTPRLARRTHIHVSIAHACHEGLRTLACQRVGHRQLLQLPPGGADAAVAKQLLDGEQVNVVFEHAHGPGTTPFEDAARKCLQ